MFLTASNEIQSLIKKYGTAVPRYTSYPTAPEWRDDFKQEELDQAINLSNQAGKDYSLYLHIPFCEKQCYYCACNIIVTPHKDISLAYVSRLKEEIRLIGNKIDKNRQLVQMAWGGGTPTYLSPAQITDIYQCIKENFNLVEQDSTKEYEYAIEIDPRVTSFEHIECLKELGFNRLSLGIQDFNELTQESINRIQSYEDVDKLVSYARQLGFQSINFDLIYGLPFQDISTFSDTIKQVIKLNPDRIALFNYAHLPMFFPFQKKYIPDHTLPDQLTKCEIFDNACTELTAKGYEFIGIDHFAKQDDTLVKAYQENRLYRNFQGYTTYDGCDLFGLGVTAISDVQGLYKQNHKKLNQYYADFTTDKFKACSKVDQERRQIIKELMCKNQVNVNLKDYSSELESLKQFQVDNLIEINELPDDLVQVKITQLGRLFARNIAATFDEYLTRKNGHKVFSKAL
jgi:oxygen-independent coproporphyrinogen-3 oxidase